MVISGSGYSWWKIEREREFMTEVTWSDRKIRSRNVHWKSTYESERDPSARRSPHLRLEVIFFSLLLRQTRSRLMAFSFLSIFWLRVAGFDQQKMYFSLSVLNMIVNHNTQKLIQLDVNPSLTFNLLVHLSDRLTGRGGVKWTFCQYSLPASVSDSEVVELYFQSFLSPHLNLIHFTFFLKTGHGNDTQNLLIILFLPPHLLVSVKED